MYNTKTVQLETHSVPHIRQLSELSKVDDHLLSTCDLAVIMCLISGTSAVFFMVLDKLLTSKENF
jgi:hypothetical protein